MVYRYPEKPSYVFVSDVFSENKSFWKTVKPFLANETSNNCNKIRLIQKDEIISRSKDVA